MKIKKALVIAFLIVASARAADTEWQSRLRAEILRGHVLGLGRGYDISSGRTHVRVTRSMAEVFDARPRAEIGAYLDQLAADETFHAQRGYILMCARAVRENTRRLPSLSACFADQRGEWLVDYRVPFGPASSTSAEK